MAVLRALRDECAALREGKIGGVFVTVVGVYDMEGTVAPLRMMLDTMDIVLVNKYVYIEIHRRRNGSKDPHF
jgi:7-keto-8-aminopelargonate synthetase-like enzyme